MATEVLVTAGIGLLALIIFMMILSMMILLPIYLQNILLTPVIAGLVLLLGGVINAFMSVVAGNMFDRFGPRGLFLCIISLFVLRTIDGTTSIYFIKTMIPTQTNGLNQLPEKIVSGWHSHYEYIAASR